MATVLKQELSSTWNGVRLINLNERCGNLVREMEKVPGVQTVCVHDNRGRVLGALFTGDFDKGDYNRVGTEIAQCLAAFQARTGCRDLELAFEKKLIYTRDLGNAFFTAYCSPTVSLSMLRMTANVAALAFETDPDLQKNLKNAADSKKDTLAPSHLDILGSQLVDKAKLK